jgi:hypothetical protein
MFASPRTALLVVAGCATACTSQLGPDRKSNHGNMPDAGFGRPDADRGTPMPMPDAALPDAAPGLTTVTLTQTTNSTPTPATSIACGACNNNTNPCNSWFTFENAYYRVFDLAQHGVTKTFHVQQVTFAVEESAGNQSVQVKVGTYNGTPGTTLDLAQVTQQVTTSVNIPPTTTGLSVPAPITTDIPAGSKLIVEVSAPDHEGLNNVYFYLGATTAGETKPGYIRSPSCGDSTPTTMASIGFPEVGILVSVTGSY